MGTGQSFGFNEDEDNDNSIFNEQQESPREVENNLYFNMPVDLGVDKLLVDNFFLDKLSPDIDTSSLKQNHKKHKSLFSHTPKNNPNQLPIIFEEKKDHISPGNFFGSEE